MQELVHIQWLGATQTEDAVCCPPILAILRPVEMFQPEHFNTRSQDLEEAWHDAGQFYWGKAEAWLTGKPIFSQDSAPVPLPRHRVQDIDTQEDWERAEWMLKARQQAQKIDRG